MNQNTADRLTKHGFSVHADYKTLVKVYNTGKRILVIRPFFNKAGDLSSLCLEDNKRKKIVKIESGEDLPSFLKDVPVICLDTIVDLVAETFGINVVKREPSFVITIECGLCKSKTPSFIALRNSIVCTKCFITGQ